MGRIGPGAPSPDATPLDLLPTEETYASVHGVADVETMVGDQGNSLGEENQVVVSERRL